MLSHDIVWLVLVSYDMWTQVLWFIAQTILKKFVFSVMYESILKIALKKPYKNTYEPNEEFTIKDLLGNKFITEDFSFTL